jgi:hypothetical protein
LEERNNQSQNQSQTVVEPNNNATKTSNSKSNSNSTNTTSTPKSTFGGHVRLGWSMRTGDLQAPVGYDKWSYGIRDIMGSKIHCSKREDHWGGEGFGPGDVVGCAICLPPKDQQQQKQQQKQQQQEDKDDDNDNDNDNANNIANNGNHILFFKNGLPMGEFVISKGKREGGAAFEGIPDGVYYPAVSLYMGASVKVNMGPHFIYPPRKLPAGLKSLHPVSDLCQKPMTVEDASQKITKEKVFRGKPDMMTKFVELVHTEVQVLQDAYQTHRRTHVQEVYAERKRRNVGVTSDLEDDEFFTKEEEEA